MKFAAQLAGVLLASCALVAAVPQVTPRPAAKAANDLPTFTGSQAVNTTEAEILIHPRSMWRKIRSELIVDLTGKAIVDSASPASKQRTRVEIQDLLKNETYWDALYAQFVKNITTLNCDDNKETFDQAIMGGEKAVVQRHDEVWHELWVITIAHQDGDLNSEKQAYHKVKQRVGDADQWRIRRRDIANRVLLAAKYNCGWNHKEAAHQIESELRPVEEEFGNFSAEQANELGPMIMAFAHTEL